MKAFYVRFDTAGTSGFSEVLLVNDEKDLEKSLEAKSSKGFKVGCNYSKITYKKEIPLNQVKIGELSVTEFMKLQGGI
ncbi:hypothetical protein CON15_19490 [Bacillus cereus]|uniref:Uncharacterized protein n=1 Tax=Bacillus thuringiensis TaxID=1428 RepID=A0A9X6U4L3_BACTU|nr:MULTISPECIES: hypothetical protein [Bacillus cereus group]MEC0031089.1 hypothetical protein [Bacillus cereus]PDZ55726.1 hypothetical protein CON15_19490 [Bacillus cereus]PED16394.1 hypothetical protein CON01_00660 [Bacillus thuringiensis]PES54416.1 hypothetical protein CN506_20285 [Bacillus thuringiensis]PFO26198.1 hypothetical protein COJ78_29285 [Bacillus thuringiensis]